GLAEFLHFPVQLIPLSIIRLFSSSAATSLALDLYKSYGTDSYIGLTASIMMGCTETVFYTMSVYFLTAKVTKSRWTLAGALVSTFAGIAASVVLAGMM
ncbi:MAG: spore maturation protein, partial [Lachnospiraceae bacterium]|nr:spore maturation protein [Lachnospiraceae bacterium]